MDDDRGIPDAAGEEAPVWKKLAWFAGLSLAGLIAVAGSAYVLRGLLLIAE